MKAAISTTLFFLSLNLSAIERGGLTHCREYALPEDTKLDQFINNSSKITGALCNQEVTRYALTKLTNAHLCRDLALDPAL